ncbi:Transcription factor S-II (TFIIS) family protein [Candida albicans]|uniref:DNA-directed RNA polymerase I subunit RPA12 n=1 Tax=Candida albicans TaxID=5476 RepID=A0A8H6BWV3_CANAX|nr:Transcription factor S-II (TFIIS) family protein [Candida albicans]
MSVVGSLIFCNYCDDAFPSKLKSARSVVKTSLKKDELDEGATIKEKCPKCGNEEMQYHTLQLRSADEGATVFYTCTNCGYRFRTNN